MKILVAFLEKPVAEAVSQAFADLGWPQPGIATTSDDAVEWINTAGGCDLLVCEVYLSPADGFALRDTVHPHLPGMKTIFSSAYDISPYVDRLDGAPFLAQPVTSDSLAACLRELFGETEQSPAPAPQPAVKATPVAVKATPATVKAAPSVQAGPSVKASPAPSLPSKEMQPDELVGRTFGKFEIEARLAERDGAGIYRVRQTNVGRLATLHLLNAEASADPEAATRFLANAKSKARLSHHRVAAVYEAGEAEGRCFFTCEHIGAPALEKFQASGAKISGTTALETIRMVAEVMETCANQKISHSPLSAGVILIPDGGLPRLVNIACEEGTGSDNPAADMKALGQALLQTLDRTADSAPARQVAMRLVQAETAPLAWPEAAALASAAMPKARPKDVEQIQAQDIALHRAVDESRKNLRTRMIIGSAISLTLTAAACYAIYFSLLKPKVNVGDLGALVEIPAGAFDFQGEQKTLPKFFISKYEVSIAEYAAFLKHVKDNPGKAADYAHPDQPPNKSHVPTGWADMEEIQPVNPGYYNRAKKWGSYQGAPLTLDSPVFGVDWFDAYAYAKWKGRRLPTEEEWEKAARGPRGTQHPWGDNASQDKANLGFDYTPKPDAGGEKDGFKRSSPVDQPSSDRSPYGVHNMAGNVSEWTASWTEDGMGSGLQVPVYRGANWKTGFNDPSDTATALRRGAKLSENQTDEALGFRTASDTPE